MQIKDAQPQTPVTISPFASSDEAIALMWKHDIRYLLVVDREGLAGMVTEGDLLESVGMLTLAERRAVGGNVCIDEIIIADIMDADCPCIRPDTLVTDAVHRMVYERRCALPVLAGSEIQGVFTEIDALRLFVGLSWLTSGVPHQEEVINFSSHVLMTVRPSEPLQEACIRLSGRQVRHLPVVEDGRLIGLLSDWDIRGAIGQYPLGEWIHLPVFRFTQTNLRTLRPGATLMEAAQLMHEEKLSALPITSRSGNLVGLITVSDVLRAFVAPAVVHI